MLIEVTIEERSAPEQAEGCALQLMRIARAINHALGQALERLGLSAQEYGLLHRLAAGGHASQAELAAAIGVHPSNLVRLLDDLEDAGLIARERDPSDRRRQLVVISGRGRRKLQSADRIAFEAEERLLEPLGPEERRALNVLLGRIAGHACSRGSAV